MSYLDRLKENFPDTSPEGTAKTAGEPKTRHRGELPKLPKAPFGSFGSGAGLRISENSEQQSSDPSQAAGTNRTQPPAAGETQPFGQRELDAIRQGFGVWVWSGVLEEWLFWVRDDERQAKALAKGIERWRIWTLDELTAAQGMTPADLRNVFEIKRRFDGAVQPGAKPQRWRDALEPLQPAVGAEELRP